MTLWTIKTYHNVKSWYNALFVKHTKRKVHKIKNNQRTREAEKQKRFQSSQQGKRTIEMLRNTNEMFNYIDVSYEMRTATAIQLSLASSFARLGCAPHIKHSLHCIC